MNDAEYWLRQGTEKRSNQNYNEAISDFTKSISIDGTALLAFFNRADCYNKIQQFKEAVEDLKKVIELEPTNAMAYIAIGNIQIKLKEFHEAKSNILKAVSLNPEYNVFYKKYQETIFEPLGI